MFFLFDNSVVATKFDQFVKKSSKFVRDRCQGYRTYVRISFFSISKLAGQDRVFFLFDNSGVAIKFDQFVKKVCERQVANATEPMSVYRFFSISG